MPNPIRSDLCLDPHSLTQNFICTDFFFNTEYFDAKGLPVLANNDLLPKNNYREKYSTTSSLNSCFVFVYIYISYYFM